VTSDEVSALEKLSSAPLTPSAGVAADHLPPKWFTKDHLFHFPI
jgi:hypothetical protein